MKPKNTLLLLFAILVAAGVVAGIYSTSHAPKPAPAPVVAAQPTPQPAPQPEPQITEPAPQIETPAPQIPDIATTAPAPRAKTPDQDPMARVALSLVGNDPDANELWIDSINNPNLSNKERKNLIEDLNEDGFLDPKHPSVIDLPLITKRLQLIDQLRPNAMDKTNAAAFDEAYKDLSKMYLKFTGTAWGQ